MLSGILGTGIAYGMWFAIVRRLSAATASLGVLGSPVIGVISSVLILGERPTMSDVVGFALILAASACVLFARGPPPAAIHRPAPRSGFGAMSRLTAPMRRCAPPWRFADRPARR